MKAFTLIETLVVCALLAILIALTCRSVIRAYHHAREWVFGVYIWHEAKLEVFLDDDSSERAIYWCATFGSQPWEIFRTNKVEAQSP